jgi:hypothetical protein
VCHFSGCSHDSKSKLKFKIDYSREQAAIGKILDIETHLQRLSVEQLLHEDLKMNTFDLIS